MICANCGKPIKEESNSHYGVSHCHVIPDRNYVTCVYANKINDQCDWNDHRWHNAEGKAYVASPIKGEVVKKNNHEFKFNFNPNDSPYDRNRLTEQQECDNLLI